MKIINRFDLDLSPLQASGDTRRFSITGEDGAGFNLEIKNEDGYLSLIHISEPTRPY